MSTTADPRLWLLAAMTGSGREPALAALEAAGVEVVDNLPVDLLAALAERPRQGSTVVAVDARRGAEISGALVPEGVGVIVLEADDALLVRRQADTTRPHPCADAGPGLGAVAAERRLLAPLRAIADTVVDTTTMDPAAVGARVVELVGPAGVATEELRCTISSFGFKYGPQPEADWVVDVRFLPNPFWIPELRAGTGLDGPVADHVLASADGSALLERLDDLMSWVAERSAARHRRHLHIAVGCTGGRHRSVAVAEALAERLRGSGLEVTTRHRDMTRPDPRDAALPPGTAG